MKDLLKTFEIDKPTLLLDQNKVYGNIRKMVEKARNSRVDLRHHAKTHQSATIASWFKEFQCTTITVSSFDMASYFAQHGWDNITVAFPTNILEINKINRLASTSTLNVLVDSKETVSYLQQHLTHPIQIWIKIDTGYQRAGVDWQNTDEIVSMIHTLRKHEKCRFLGILAHAGHVYKCKTPQEIRDIYRETVSRMQQVKETIEKTEVSHCLISIGNTPACSLIQDFKGVDEIRPGNFVFYDLMQYMLGSCRPEEIAVAVACPVAGMYPHRREILLYGGAAHFSKEFLLNDRGEKIYGYLAFTNETTWNGINWDAPVVSLSQEHGLLRAQEKLFRDVKIGDILLILPVHSCLTAALYCEYMTLEGITIKRRRHNNSL